MIYDLALAYKIYEREMQFNYDSFSRLILFYHILDMKMIRMMMWVFWAIILSSKLTNKTVLFMHMYRLKFTCFQNFYS